jgi:hypothetical protein
MTIMKFYFYLDTSLLKTGIVVRKVQYNYGFKGEYEEHRLKCFRKTTVSASIGDPDPHVFVPPGSGSLSIGQRYGSESESFPFLK